MNKVKFDIKHIHIIEYIKCNVNKTSPVKNYP